MTIDLSAIGLLFIAGIASFLGWTVKRIVADLKSLEKDHAEFKTYVAKTYVSRADINQQMTGFREEMHGHLNDIKDTLKRVLEKLDSR